MSSEDNQKGENRRHINASQAFITSFWLVFTLPFRVVIFAFKRIAGIPLKNLLLMAAIFVGLVAVTMVLFVEFTSQPKFCTTCHYMRPYFDSWQKSSHNQVHCTMCHFLPGVQGTIRGKFTAVSMLVNYTTGVYKKSKPWAEISDQSCLRDGCHETRLLKGKVKFKEGIIFDHTPHLTKDRRGKTLRCTSCHSQIVQGSHITVTETTCFLCHFKDQPENAPTTNCQLCHHAPVANDSTTVSFDHTEMIEKEVDCRLCHGNMEQGRGNVSKDRCNACHAEAEKLGRFSQTVEVHRIHITEHKVECSRCHDAIQHKSIARTGHIKPDCQSCHLDRHLAQYALFSGQGAEGVDPLPATMFNAGLGCKACHVLLSEAERKHPDRATYKAGAASCTPCHLGDYYKLYEQAKPVISRRVIATQRRISNLKRKTLGSRADSVLTVCASNLDLIKRGQPIHNLEYSDRILDEINRSLDVFEGKKVGIRTLPDTTSERCIKCHYGQDEAVVPYRDKQFSHRLHVHGYQVGCADCHEEEKPDHGRLRKGSFCMDCHHQSAAVSCDPCHSTQRDFIAGQGAFTDFHPETMFDMGMTCRDCHDVTGKTVSRPTAETCEACHETGFYQTFENERTSLYARMTALVKKLPKGSSQKESKHLRDLVREVKTDGTEGAHNMAAMQEIVKALEAAVGDSSGNVATDKLNN